MLAESYSKIATVPALKQNSDLGVRFRFHSISVLERGNKYIAKIGCVWTETSSGAPGPNAGG